MLHTQKIMATRKSTNHNYKNGSVVSPSLPQPTTLTPQQLEEKIAKGICYNCDSKYIKGHKCAEKKLFYIDCEEEEEKDQETSKEEDIHQELTLEKEEMNLTISCTALERITTPQTLKIEGLMISKWGSQASCLTYKNLSHFQSFKYSKVFMINQCGIKNS